MAKPIFAVLAKSIRGLWDWVQSERTREEAIKRGEQISSLNPGKEVWVLETVKSFFTPSQTKEMGRMNPLDINKAIEALGRGPTNTFPWAGSKRSYSLRRAGLGKFEGGFLVDRWVYGLSLEEGESIGDVTEIGWVVTPVTLGPDAVKEVQAEAKEDGDKLMPDEEAFISDMFGAMVVEDDQGFVDVEYFETEREWLDKRKEWERAEEEFREGVEE